MEPFAARARKLGWNVHTMAQVHEVMITHPNELAEILLRIANKQYKVSFCIRLSLDFEGFSLESFWAH